MIKNSVGAYFFAVAVTALMGSTAIAGATDLKDIQDVGIKSNQVGQDSQENINQIVDQTDKITNDYKMTLRTTEGLRIYNAQLQRQIALQHGEMDKLAKSIKGVTLMKRQITPLMIKMVDSLGEFIAHDLPIKREERMASIIRLKELMQNPNVDASEKFRSVFEVYQIESQYGRAVQAYTGKIRLDGNELEVDMLHIGRIALVYQTRDGKQSGVWDKNSGQWIVLDTSYGKSIRQALAVAHKQAAADTLLMLPMSAPVARYVEAAK